MRPISVLFVDDDPIITDIFKEFLEKYAEYVVDTVSSAQEAIKKVSHSPYDIIVSDYAMPEMNGLELLQQIRLSSQIPFILITATDSEEVIIDAINNGVDFYLKKGHDINHLFAELNHMIPRAVQKKRASDAIQENISNFERRFELTPIPVLISSPDGTIIKINPAGVSLFALSNPDLLQDISFIKEIIGEDAFSRVLSGDTFSIASQINFAEVHTRYPGIFDRADTIYFTVFFVPTVTIDGKITEYVIQIIDNTSEFLAKDDLRKISEQLGLAIESSQLGMWDWNIQTGELACNDRWAEILGHSLEELSPVTIQTFFDLMHPEDLQPYNQLLQSNLSGEMPFLECEFRMLHKDGHWVWVYDRGKVVELNSEGRPLRMTGTHADVTERKVREDHIRRQKNILYEISHAATHLMSSPSEDSIYEIISGIGKAVGVSRAAFFTYSSTPDGISTISISHEWIEEKGNASQNTNQKLPSFDLTNNVFARWAQVLMNRGIISGNITDLPEAEQSLLTSLSIKSFAAVPIFSSGEFFGYLGFFSDNDRDWFDFEFETLEIAAGLLGASFGRQKAEEEVMIRENNISTFFNTIDDFLFVLDTQGAVIKVNDTVTDRLGYRKEEVIGKPFLLTHPEERREEAKECLASMLSGTRDLCPIPLIAKDGTLIPVESRVVPGVWNGQSALFGVSKDISEITLSEEKFSKAFESAGTLMAISIDSVYTNVNKAFLDTLGYKWDEVVGKGSLELELFVNVDERNQVLADIREKGYCRNKKVLLRGKGGRVLTVIFSADIIQIQNKEALLVIMSDVTEMNRLSDALLQANTKLNLLSSITRHDILNQVQALFFVRDLLNTKIPEDSTAREELAMLAKAVDTIYRQINFTKDYQDLGVVSPVWIQVEAVVMKELADKIFSDISIEVMTGDLEIYVDPMFSKVCYNLFENALRHGEHVTRITVHFRKSGESGLLTFEDNGMGVPQADKEKIFNRGVGKNTGFGLFLTKEILSITGISIRENGEEGKGARFELLIPAHGFRMRSPVQ